MLMALTNASFVGLSRASPLDCSFENLKKRNNILTINSSCVHDILHVDKINQHNFTKRHSPGRCFMRQRHINHLRNLTTFFINCLRSLLVNLFKFISLNCELNGKKNKFKK